MEIPSAALRLVAAAVWQLCARSSTVARRPRNDPRGNRARNGCAPRLVFRLRQWRGRAPYRANARLDHRRELQALRSRRLGGPAPDRALRFSPGHDRFLLRPQTLRLERRRPLRRVDRPHLAWDLCCHARSHPCSPALPGERADCLRSLVPACGEETYRLERHRGIARGLYPDAPHRALAGGDFTFRDCRKLLGCPRKTTASQSGAMALTRLGCGSVSSWRSA